MKRLNVLRNFYFSLFFIFLFFFPFSFFILAFPFSLFALMLARTMIRDIMYTHIHNSARGNRMPTISLSIDLPTWIEDSLQVLTYISFRDLCRFTSPVSSCHTSVYIAHHTCNKITININIYLSVI